MNSSANNQSLATKEDIQMLLESMQQMGKEIEQKLEQKLEQKHEETRRHLSVLIEDAEERFLQTSHDKISVHEDRLNNHKGRITRLEKAIL